jgi:hypothetical protein
MCRRRLDDEMMIFFTHHEVYAIQSRNFLIRKHNNFLVAHDIFDDDDIDIVEAPLHLLYRYLATTLLLPLVLVAVITATATAPAVDSFHSMLEKLLSPRLRSL